MQMTIKAILQRSREQLNSESAQLDVELLLGFCLSQSRAYLYTWPDRVPSEQQLSRFESLLARRIQGEPIAYIIGNKEFWSLNLELSHDALIPRPETELLVENALALLPDRCQRVVDLGTGSGAIALALAKERPFWQVYACDYCSAVVKLAERNRQRLGLDNLQLFQGNWAAALKSNSWNLVISNPPYIAEDDPHLERGDLRYEPRSALVAADQGLAAIKNIAEQAVRLLCQDGWLMIEHGYQQKSAVQAILSAKRFHHIDTLTDLAGNERMTLGQKQGQN